MNSTPGQVPQPLREVLKYSVFSSSSCGKLWSKWDTYTHCGIVGEAVFSVYEQKFASGCLVKSRLWGWKIWWQIKCAGTVLLIHGLHIPAAPLRLEDWEAPWRQVMLELLGNITSLLFISQVTCESWEGFTPLKLFCLSKKYQDFSFHLCSYVVIRVSNSSLWFWGSPPLFKSQVLLPPEVLHSCFLHLQTAEHHNLWSQSQLLIFFVTAAMSFVTGIKTGIKTAMQFVC